jgi:hypothetical protein
VRVAVAEWQCLGSLERGDGDGLNGANFIAIGVVLAKI